MAQPQNFPPAVPVAPPNHDRCLSLYDEDDFKDDNDIDKETLVGGVESKKLRKGSNQLTRQFNYGPRHVNLLLIIMLRIGRKQLPIVMFNNT